jgi:hypothetical protein
VDAEASRLVGRGTDHAALVRAPTNDHRSPLKGWIVQDLDAGVERVQIGVPDRSNGRAHTARI